MPFPRKLYRAIPLALICLGAASCELFDDPCGERFLDGHVGMQGIWVITELEGEAIQPHGNKLPGSDDYLVAGSIEFDETSVDGTCEDPKVSRGTIIVRITLGDGAGHVKSSDSYPGEYKLDHKTNAVTLTAINKNAAGTRAADHEHADIAVLDPAVGLLPLATMTISRASTDNLKR